MSTYPMQQAPFQVNARSLAFDLGQTFNPLATGFGLDFKVTPAPNGYVCLSLALPEGMTRSFVALLQSLYGLMQVVDAKTRAAHAQARALDVHQIAADQQHQRTFSELCCALFDQQRDHGATINEAIRAVNRALKDQRHPWATYDTVKEELRRNGRLSSKPKARRKRGKDGS